MIFIGIDPGLSGAIAWLKPATREVRAWDMPVQEIMTGGKRKRHIDFAELNELFYTQLSGCTQAVLEQVGAMPGQGVTSMFSFGKSVGAVEMALAAHKMPYMTVTPQKWKRHFNLNKGKDESRRLVQRIFPSAAHLVARVKDDGRAEAILLAHYAAMKAGAYGITV